MYYETLCKEIIRNNVNSTKKWLYRYLLDEMRKTFEACEKRNMYSLAKKCVEDIYVFQNEILNQIDMEPKKVVIGKATLESIERVRREEIIGKIIKQIESEVEFAKCSGMSFDITIEKILTIIRGQ